MPSVQRLPTDGPDQSSHRSALPSSLNTSDIGSAVPALPSLSQVLAYNVPRKLLTQLSQAARGSFVTLSNGGGAADPALYQSALLSSAVKLSQRHCRPSSHNTTLVPSIGLSQTGLLTLLKGLLCCPGPVQDHSQCCLRFHRFALES